MSTLAILRHGLARLRPPARDGGGGRMGRLPDVVVARRPMAKLHGGPRLRARPAFGRGGSSKATPGEPANREGRGRCVGALPASPSGPGAYRIWASQRDGVASVLIEESAWPLTAPSWSPRGRGPGLRSLRARCDRDAGPAGARAAGGGDPGGPGPQADRVGHPRDRAGRRGPRPVAARRPGLESGRPVHWQFPRPGPIPGDPDYPRRCPQGAPDARRRHAARLVARRLEAGLHPPRRAGRAHLWLLERQGQTFIGPRDLQQPIGSSSRPPWPGRRRPIDPGPRRAEPACSSGPRTSSGSRPEYRANRRGSSASSRRCCAAWRRSAASRSTSTATRISASSRSISTGEIPTCAGASRGTSSRTSGSTRWISPCASAAWRSRRTGVPWRCGSARRRASRRRPSSSWRSTGCRPPSAWS